MDFCTLLKTLVKIKAVNMVKIFLILKTASKREIKKKAEATGYFIGNKIADKITNVSKNSTKELQNNKTKVDVVRATLKKRYISPEERHQLIDELRLVQQYNNGISKNSKFLRQRSCAQCIK